MRPRFIIITWNLWTGFLSCNWNNDTNARLQVLFIICLVFLTIILILDTWFKRNCTEWFAIIRLLLFLYVFCLPLLFHIFLFFLYIFLLLIPRHCSVSLHIYFLLHGARFSFSFISTIIRNQKTYVHCSLWAKDRKVAHLNKIFHDF
jgi:hypothetical protein